MTALRIHLFGHPRVFVTSGRPGGDTPAALPAPNKVLLLAAYLLLNRQQPVLRDHLAYTMWPDATESEARANLRRHLHLLRKQLPDPPNDDTPWVLTTHQTVHWNPDATVWLDVAMLEDFDANTADETDWARLLDAYGGEFLSGLYDDWVLSERYRLEQRFIQLLHQRLGIQKQHGDWAGAARTAHRILSLDPLSEEPYRELMELHYRAGDRAAALAEFDKCQAMLAREMATEPMPETLALRQAILSGEALPPIADVSPPSRKPARRAQDELARTQNRRQQTKDDADVDTVDTLSRLQPLLQEDQSHDNKSRRGLLLAVVVIGLLLALAVAAIGLRAAGLTFPGAASQGHTVTLSGPDVTEDTWIDKDTPDLIYDPADPQKTPREAYQQVHLMYHGYPYDRVLLRFEMGSIAPDARVEHAILHVHLDVFNPEDGAAPPPATLSAFRVLRPWTAAEATFNQPWTEPGLAAAVDYAEAPLDSQSFRGESWVTLDVTEAVQAWLADPERNYGLMLMLTAAPQGAHYWLDTSDYPLSDRWPRLEVTFTP
jgi:DNA-binding SARP family transcriptional activator